MTAPKESRPTKPEMKTMIPGYRRPTSAKAHSLQQIIQVIEDTLNKGAQTILNRSKTLDNFSKLKNQIESAKKKKSQQGKFKEV